MKKSLPLLALLTGLTGFALAPAAQAHTDVHIGLGIGVPYYPPAVIVEPPRYRYYPEPVYYPAPEVVYYGAPRYYEPRHDRYYRRDDWRDDRRGWRDDRGNWRGTDDRRHWDSRR